MPAKSAATTPQPASWIESYLDYVKNQPAPEIFKRWAAMGAIAIALEKRCYVYTADSPVYPNLYIMLVGRPGIGKSQAINPVGDLLNKTGCFNLVPDDLTGSALLDHLASSEMRVRQINNSPENREYHSGGLLVSEMGTLIREHDLSFLSILSNIYDCPPLYRQIRRHSKSDPINITNPQLTMVAGTQPGYLGSVFPPEAWVQGFMSRVIMIHSGEETRPKLFAKTRSKKDETVSARLVQQLATLAELEGEFIFDEDAAEALEAWYEGRMQPEPTAHRLQGYNARRGIQIQKLCMVIRASRWAMGQRGMDISLEDYTTAMNLLLQAEEEMPNVFMEMAGKSDIDVLRDLHSWGWRQYIESGRRALYLSEIMNFLTTRVSAWQSQKVWNSALEADYFRLKGGTSDEYYPVARGARNED